MLRKPYSQPRELRLPLIFFTSQPLEEMPRVCRRFSTHTCFTFHSAMYLGGGRGLGIRRGANMTHLALPRVTEGRQAISSHRTYGDRNDPVGDINHYWHLNSTCKGRALPSGH